VVGHDAEVLLEVVQPGAPEPPVGLQPILDGAQGLGPQAIDAPLGIDPDLDEAGLPKDAKVLGDCGLAHAERIDEVADGTLLISEEIEDAPAVGLGQNLEGHHLVIVPCGYITVKDYIGGRLIGEAGSMGFDAAALPDEVLAFLTERWLATLTTLRPDGSPHVVAVGFTFDPSDGKVRVITGGGSRKVANIKAGGRDARAVVCQVDGGRWLALEGHARVSEDPGDVAEAVRRYTLRYRAPRRNPSRVAIEIAVDRVLGRA
jgi:F420H(2)-dependent biliverdin reductase